MVLLDRVRVSVKVPVTFERRQLKVTPLNGHTVLASPIPTQNYNVVPKLTQLLIVIEITLLKI